MHHGYKILLRPTSVWLMNNIGLCLFNIAIYGGAERRYSDFLNAYTATLYSQAALSEQSEAKLGYSAFIFTVINNYTLYFLNIVLVGMTLTSIMSEYQNEAL